MYFKKKHVASQGQRAAWRRVSWKGWKIYDETYLHIKILDYAYENVLFQGASFFIDFLFYWRI